MRHRKKLALLFAWWLALFWMIPTFAANNPRVFSEAVTVKPGTEIVVPICIDHNDGLMGFRITVKYPQVFRLKNLSSGSLTQEGLFNSTITDYESVNGYFEVVWSDSQETKADGTVMMLTFAVSDLADEGDYEIELGFREGDTFNESFDPVALQCENIRITVSNQVAISTTSVLSSTMGTQTTQTGASVSNDYLLASVDAIVQTFDAHDPAQITDTRQQDVVVQFVNNRNQAFDPNALQYDSFNALLTDYQMAASSEAQRLVLDSVDEDVLVQSAQSILQKYDAGSFAELSGSEKAEAVQNMQQKIADAGGDTTGFAKLADENAVAQTLDIIVESAKETQDSSISVNAVSEQNKTNKHQALIIGTIIVGTAVLISVSLIEIKKIQRRKRK